jgi:SAM-dependent methyltransferase
MVREHRPISMEPSGTHTTKAEKYAKYRWDYAAKAIDQLLVRTNLGTNHAVADVGSGTGILTRHLLARAGRVFAVEPDPAMQRMARDALGQHPGFRPVAGISHRTTLPPQSVDLVTAGQALHWFDPLPSREEFRRILKPGGRLVVIWNRMTDPKLLGALGGICTAENGFAVPRPPSPGSGTPPSFYLDDTETFEARYDFRVSETWEGFEGGLLSDATAPDEDHPGIGNFRRDARRVFDEMSTDGRIQVQGRTELIIGRVHG